MRRIIGGIVLIAGLGGLSFWGAQDHAQRIQAAILEGAQAAVAGSTHRAEVAVSGRDITLSGLADSPSEREALLSALGAVEGRRVVRDETRLLDPVSPYVTAGRLSDDGARVLEGAVPTEAARAALGARAGDLTLASGAPAGWSALTESAEAALDRMARGDWRLEDGALRLTGVARSADDREAALALLEGLPADVAAEIEVIPLITPFSTTGLLAPDGGIALSGFVPGPDARQALGGVADDLARADGSPQDWLALTQAGIDSLANLAAGEFAVTGRDLVVTGKARSAADRDAIRAILDDLEANTGAKAASDLRVVPLVQAYVTEASKGSGGAVAYSGYVPSDYGRGLLGNGAGGLILADGAPADWEGLATAGRAALDMLDSGSWMLEGARLSLVGVARSASARGAALTALEGLAAPEDVAIEVIPLVAPFTTSGTKPEGGALALSGYAPKAALEAYPQLAKADGAPEDWGRLIAAALEALDALAEGRFALSDRTLMVSGKARSAEDKARAMLAVGRLGSADVLTEITVVPLIAPFVTEAVKAPDGAPQLSGYAPAEYALEVFGAAGETLELADGAPGNWEALAEAGNAALAPLHEGRWLLEGEALTVIGIARTQAAREQAITALDEAPGARADITVVPRISPYVTAGTIGLEGAESLTGHAPDRAALDALGAAGAAVGLGVGAPEDWAEAIAAARAAMQPLARGSWSLTDRVLALRGVARTAEAAAMAEEAAYALDGFAIDLQFEVIPLITPFVTSARKTEGAAPIYGGYVPQGASGAGLDAVGALPIAEGAPESWPQLARAGQAALAELASGGWAISGDGLSVTGIARSADQRDAAQAALGALGDAASSDIAVEPPSVAVTLDAAKGAAVSGLAPGGLGLDALSQALGMPLQGDLQSTTFGDGAALLGALEALRPWFDQIDSAALDSVGDDITLDAQLLPGADPAYAKAALAEALPGAALTLTTAPTPANGASRSNALTGLTEEAVAGFWLPVMTFDPGPQSCPRETEAAQARGQIGFVTGSANLSAESLAAINRLASVVRRCVLRGSLRVDIGGHTDNRGEAEANFVLSLARAQAVRAALVARGVPAQSIGAIGFGETQPIASNDTEAGRASNRRTTLTWATGPT